MASVETVARTADPRLAALKRMAIVPALNEEGGVVRVIEEIRTFDPELEMEERVLRVEAHGLTEGRLRLGE